MFALLKVFLITIISPLTLGEITEPKLKTYHLTLNLIFGAPFWIGDILTRSQHPVLLFIKCIT
jgi:hypothetical protein